MTANNRKIIAITMGDPAGVGPEIIVKALLDRKIQDICRPVVIGDYKVLKQAYLDYCDVSCADALGEIEKIEDLEKNSSQVCVLDLQNVYEPEFTSGVVKAEYGKAAGEYIKKAIELALEKKVDAVVTAPIHKQAFREAGHPYPGHTEMFASLCKSKKVTLMLAKDHFRVVHVTLHSSLKEAIPQITKSSVLDVIQIAHDGMKDFGIIHPKIGVCGLNPHAGEGGQFGDEEEKHIAPAVLEAKAKGILVEGPMSADSIFGMLNGGEFDIVVAMYHDQGGIPMKLLSFSWDKTNNRWGSISGVNITLGLPIIRTSVAHGTAFEITGQGIASPQSMKDAIQAACQMAAFRLQNER